jgi:hypothetical protein
MARLRSFVVQFPAIVVAALALAFSLGGGAGYAASAAEQPMTVSFHVLKLMNGWSKDTAATGAPAYAVSNDVVYLKGGMHQTAGSNNEFAVLPAGARPAHTLWIGVYSEATTSAFLEITPSGAMFIGGTDAQFFASLAGVSFVVGS